MMAKIPLSIMGMWHYEWDNDGWPLCKKSLDYQVDETHHLKGIFLGCDTNSSQHWNHGKINTFEDKQPIFLFTEPMTMGLWLLKIFKNKIRTKGTNMLINHIENHLKQTNPSKQNENRSIFLQKQTCNNHVSDGTDCQFLQVTLRLHPKNSTNHKQLEQDTVRRPGSISKYSEFLKISFWNDKQFIQRKQKTFAKKETKGGWPFNAPYKENP